MTNLDSLVVFAKIAEAGSMSRAALTLGMPLSTVSRKLAALESQLGVRLIERSNRTLRLTEVGADVLEQAKQAAEIGDSIHNIASNSMTDVQGRLRLSAPPSISESLLIPLVRTFQSAHPKTRIDVLVTDRHVDHVSEGVDLTFRFGALKDSRLIARPILRYRHMLVASPQYLATTTAPERPSQLLHHRLFAFSFWAAKNSWTFVRDGKREVVSFEPVLSMNDYLGLAAALVAGGGIGELPPIVLPSAMEQGLLVEVMPEWKLRPFDLSLVHVSNRNVSRVVRAFIGFAAESVPKMFKGLPV